MAKIAFVQNLTFEFLGVMYLSAMLKKHGHSVAVYIVKDENDSLDEIKAFNPDIVGFSCTTGMHFFALEFASALKKKLDCKVVLGGPHATFFPDIIKEKAVDVVCRGEGEYALVELANNIDKGIDATNVANCWFKKNGSIIKNDLSNLIENLDVLPFPDRNLYITKYPFLNKSQKPVIGGRGCPFGCTFCFNHAYRNLYQGKGNMVRRHSVDNLIEEIKLLKDKHSIRTIYMQDDTFILDKPWIREFSKKYPKQIDLPFICHIRADLADEETVRLLTKAGCNNVFFGVETGCDDLRNNLLKKRITNKQIIKTAKLLKHFGIKFRTYNILGLPGETIDQALETVRINQQIKTDFPWCSLFLPFPGTELTEHAIKHGLIDANTKLNNPSFFKESVLKSKHQYEFTNLQKLFFYAVKYPSLMPLIRKLIRLRPNIIFELAFLAGYGWCSIKSEHLSFREVMNMGLRNVREFFFEKRD